jgi:hypothetical protein
MPNTKVIILFIQRNFCWLCDGFSTSVELIWFD